LKGHSSYVSHLDFSLTGEYLQSNSGAGELFYWDVKDPKAGKRVKDPADAKDEEWLTGTCVYGWASQGVVMSAPKGTNIHGVSRSHGSALTKMPGKTVPPCVPVTAAVDDMGQVKLYVYPCVAATAPEKAYHGHSSNVSSCRFTFDDDCLITIGGSDNAVFQWKTDCVEESKLIYSERGAALSAAPEDETDDGELTLQPKSFASTGTGVDTMFQDDAGGGDEFMAVKPWKGIFD
jgi:WD40 repeat protein